MWKMLKAIFPSGSQKCYLNGRQITLDSDLSNVENQPIEYVYTFYRGKCSLILLLETSTKYASVIYSADGSIKVCIKDKDVPLNDELWLQCKYVTENHFRIYDLLLYCLDYVKYKRYNLFCHNCRDFAGEFVRHFGCKEVSIKDMCRSCEDPKVK
jgi:hypothetical protein